MTEIISVHVLVTTNLPSKGFVVVPDDEDGAFVGASGNGESIEEAMRDFIVSAELHADAIIPAAGTPDASRAIVVPYFG